MIIAGLLSTALLFGGMTLYSFGFAALLFKALPASLAGQTLRTAFPYFYLFVMVTSVFAAAMLWTQDRYAAVILIVIAATTLPVRQILVPAINVATDTQAKTRFNVLHGLSVAITLAHVGLAGFILTRLVQI